MGDVAATTAPAPAGTPANVPAAPSPIDDITTSLDNGPPPKKAMKIPWKPIIYAAGVVAIIAIIAAVGKKKMHIRDQVAAAGWMLFTQNGCGACTRQKLDLGGYAAYELNCSTNKLRGKPVEGSKFDTPKCAAIKAFPFWFNTITGKSLTGAQSMADLAAMT